MQSRRLNRQTLPGCFMTALNLQPSPPAAPPLRRSDRAYEIFKAALDGMEAGHSVGLITVTRLTGRSARPLGAQMIVYDDGRYCGYVAGGCIEGAVAAEAVAAIAAGRGRTLTLGEGSPFFDIVLPCGGGMTVDIRLLQSIAIPEKVVQALSDRQTFSIVLGTGSSIGVELGERDTGWNDDRFIKAFRPSTRLVVVGRGLEAESLVRLAVQAGLEVRCATPDQMTLEMAQEFTPYAQHLTSADAFEPLWVDVHSAVAILFHDLDWELPLLRTVLTRPAFYVGALGSHTTQTRRIAALQAAGTPAAQMARIRGPIGAFGPTRDADTLAVSILADVMSASRNRT